MRYTERENYSGLAPGQEMTSPASS